jgi:hypothetical protein
MNVLGDLVSRNRRSDTPALLAPVDGREYDYRRFCTTAWKVSSLFRHFGVRDGSTVALADDTRPEPILAFLGTALLGGIARFAPQKTETEIDARTLVTPVERSHEYDLPPGSKMIVYGGPPDDPHVAYFEQDVWSENPTEPPDYVESEQPVLCEETTYTHTDLLDAAQSVVDEWDFAADDVVAIRSSLCEPETIAAGIVAPLLVDGTILLPDSDGENEIVGDYVVAAGNGHEHKPEAQVIVPEAIGC